MNTWKILVLLIPLWLQAQGGHPVQPNRLEPVGSALDKSDDEIQYILTLQKFFIPDNEDRAGILKWRYLVKPYLGTEYLLEMEYVEEENKYILRGRHALVKMQNLLDGDFEKEGKFYEEKILPVDNESARILVDLLKWAVRTARYTYEEHSHSGTLFYFSADLFTIYTAKTYDMSSAALPGCLVRIMEKIYVLFLKEEDTFSLQEKMIDEIKNLTDEFKKLDVEN